MKRKLICFTLFVITFSNWSIAQNKIPFTIENRTNVSDNEIYVAIVGKSQIIDDQFIFLDINEGVQKPMDRSLNTQPGPVGDDYSLGPDGQNRYADIFVKLSDIQNKTVMLEAIESSRVFFSFYKPLYLFFHCPGPANCIDQNGNPVGGGYTTPDANNPADPNRDILFEMIELNLENDGGNQIFHGNTSRVDSFQNPIGLEITGSRGTQVVGEVTSKANIVNSFRANAPFEFRGCLDEETGIITAPSKTPEFREGGQYANYYQPYIDRVWEKYKNIRLSFRDGDGVLWEGGIQGERLVVTANAPGNDLNGRVAIIEQRPNTQEVLEGKGVFDSGNGYDKRVQAQFCAAFNRHIINDQSGVNPGIQDWGDVSNFYKATPYNFYASFWHMDGIVYENRGYGFAYDDVFDQATLLYEPQTSLINVILGSITDTNTNNPGISLPGIVEAEDYNEGGEGVGYHDVNSGNTGGAYRNDDVDIENTGDATGSYNVGWIEAGEWLAYDINATAATGIYDIDFRVASPSGNGSFHLELDGASITDVISVPATGNWQNFETVKVDEVSIESGHHELRIVFDSNGLNLNFVEFRESSNDTGGGSGCSGTAANGEYSYEASSNNENPTITFIPETTGTGNGVCILYYGTSATGPYPGYGVAPNVPFQINANQGEQVYFYYTYSLPTGGENNTAGTPDNFTVGECSTTGSASLNSIKDENGEVSLGTISSFKQTISKKAQNSSKKMGTDKYILSVKIAEGKTLDLHVNFQEEENGELTLAGKVNNSKNNSFFIKIGDENIIGSILLKNKNVAYEYYSKDNEVFILEKGINEVICIGQPFVPVDDKKQSKIAVAARTDLESKSGAEACVYLDFDGHYLPAGSRWNNGNPINAAPSNLSSAEIEESWEIIAEDFRPYNVNITTNKAVFDSYAPNRRMWCVFTPTDTAAPGYGGVAYLNSFGHIENEVCWVFQGGAKFSGEAASHELGHTLGLSHDGRTNPGEEYYGGQGNWAPIMGVGYSKPISQWSRGEYANSSNTQDDLSVMAGFIRFRNDDHGNSFSNSTYINKDTAGNIDQQYGIIETTGDQDMFAFDCGTGNVYLDINTVNRHGDLDVKVNLYEGSSGNQIGTFNGSGLNTRLEAYLGEGRYYIGVDGTGVGNPVTDGYSDYASLGSFWITGTVPPAANNGVVTLYQHCPYTGYSVNLQEGSYTLGQLQSLGLVNDDVSSIKVQSGYKATLYWDDNFQGTTLMKTSDDDCLGDDGFNDEISSIVISRNVSETNVIEAEDYSNMAGVEIEPCNEGGQNVGYIDTGDWMAYSNINFPVSGNYLIEYRVASPIGGGILSADLNAGATALGQINTPNTGGWQNWTTISHTVFVNSGTHSFGIFAQSGGWNINWIRITQQGSAQTIDQNETSLIEGIGLVEGENDRISVYPNPFTNSIIIKYNGKNAKYALYDMQGRIIIPTTIIESNNSIDVSNLKRGLYLFTIEKDGVTQTKQLIKE